MAKIKDINLIICWIFIEPYLEGTHSKLFSDSMHELIVVRDLISNFRNEGLHFTPKLFVDFSIDLLT